MKELDLFSNSISMLLAHYHVSDKFRKKLSLEMPFIDLINWMANTNQFLLLSASFFNSNMKDRNFDKTLSLFCILKKVKEKNSHVEVLETKIKNMIENNTELIEKLSKERNKRLAHWDIKEMLEGTGKLTFDDFEKIVKLVVQISCVLQFPNNAEKRAEKEKDLLSSKIIE